MLEKKTEHGREQLMLDIHDLPSGSYFLQISTRDFIQTVRAFVR